MSVVLVCLPGAPKISEEAVKKEEELDKYLETRVEGLYQLLTLICQLTLRVEKSFSLDS